MSGKEILWEEMKKHNDKLHYEYEYSRISNMEDPWANENIRLQVLIPIFYCN